MTAVGAAYFIAAMVTGAAMMTAVLVMGMHDRRRRLDEEERERARRGDPSRSHTHSGR